MSEKGTGLSLLDLAGKRAVTWYVMYLEREEPRWWNSKLKNGFQHVQLCRPVSYGPLVSDTFWLVVDPGMEFVVTDAVFSPEPPWMRAPHTIVQRVVAICTEKSVRNWFFFGPVTCVEITKAYLGISSLLIRTPWQLYKYIAKRGGILTPR